MLFYGERAEEGDVVRAIYLHLLSSPLPDGRTPLSVVRSHGFTLQASRKAALPDREVERGNLRIV